MNPDQFIGTAQAVTCVRLHTIVRRSAPESFVTRLDWLYGETGQRYTPVALSRPLGSREGRHVARGIFREAAFIAKTPQKLSFFINHQHAAKAGESRHATRGMNVFFVGNSPARADRLLAAIARLGRCSRQRHQSRDERQPLGLLASGCFYPRCRPAWPAAMR